MQVSVAQKLMNAMLEGKELEEKDILELVGAGSDEPNREALHLEFKHGDELKEKGKAAATVRQYVSGFANADGGLLVLGILDPS